MRNLALVAGNPDSSRPPAPRLLYRDAIAAGICQKCRTSPPGVRTIGSRRREDLHWSLLALCPGCIELAREQGYPVMS